MLEPRDPTDETTQDAMTWLGDTLDHGEWINGSWLGRTASYEMRIVDIVGPGSRHRLVYRLAPLEDSPTRFDGLDYDALQDLLDEIKEIASSHDLVLWEFGGLRTTIPGD